MTAALLSPPVTSAPREEPTPPGAVPVAHLFGFVGWGSVICGVAALSPLPPVIKAVLLGIFVLTGPGIAAVARLKLPRAAAIAAVPAVGLAAMSASTMVLTWFHHPVGVLLHVVALVAVAAALPRRPVGALRVSRPTLGGLAPMRSWPAALLAVAVAGWLVALPGLRNAPYSQFGLLFVGTGPAIALCTLVAVGGFVSALRQGRLVTAAVAIGVVVAIQRLTVTLVTDVPIYNWAYKHLGVVDYIRRFHDLPGGSDIYGQWPSFFTAFAWFGDVSALDPTVVAHVFAPLIHVLIAVEIVAIAKLLGFTSKVALAAAMIAELVNWVGQDYFAPQSLAFVIALGIVALLIASATHRVAGYLSIPLFAALVPLHQLTPYWLCGVAVVLTIAGRVRPRWLPLPYVVLLVAYLIPRLAIVAPYGIFSFNPVANAQSNIELEGSFGKFFTSTVCRSLSAAVVLLAVVCMVIWWRRRQPFLIAAVLAFGSFALLAGQSYGGEAIFRVYLYAIPGCALLIAPLVVYAIDFRSTRALLRRAVQVAVVSALSAAALAGLQGYYGLWSIVVEHRSQIDVGAELLAQEKTPIKVMSLYPGGGLSTRSTADYLRFTERDKDFDQSIPALPADFLRDFPNKGQLDEITAGAAGFEGNTFIVFDQQASLALDYYRYLPPGAISTFEAQLRASPQWRIRDTDDVTTIFEFNRDGGGVEAPPRCANLGWFSGEACGVGNSVGGAG
ncbi:hypothetical protein [Mycolicibacterium sediminis]|uniref:Uncharacterized protein n=1 Tax=Mycolicibacterium sediminis TaxID=1286180 RepID=A0A7I7QNN1_9MYCO|nr:hypothetical protein [Mycolicibacterium sediminis]BBY27924.1 hypothetical protein MSEDJ_20200 [Mycolicibacterium sediminis]